MILMKLCLVAEFNIKIINCPKFSYKLCLWSPRTLDWALGLYLASSLVNHSCDANMYEVFYGTSTVFRARRPIIKGEQLTCSNLEPELPAVYIDYGQRQKASHEIPQV
jgi:SET domain